MAARTKLTVLVHEWATGGALAGIPLPDSMARNGSAMRRAIARDFAAMPSADVKVVMTLDRQLPAEPGPWSLESLDRGEYSRRIRELALAADFTVLIAPETSEILAGLTATLEDAGARLLGSSREAVELTGDKARLAEWLRARGIDTPPTRTIVPSDGPPEGTEYPAVVKPVAGAGSALTYYLDGPDDFTETLRMMPEAVLQPFVPGKPMSASFLVCPKGRARLIGIGKQRMEIRDGRFRYRGGEIPALCRDAAHQVRRAVDSVDGLGGFVGVDFIWDDERGHATILEINPRPTTSVVGLCRLLPAGRLAQAWLEAFRPPPRDDDLLESLVTLVHTQKAVAFDDAGNFADSSE